MTQKEKAKAYDESIKVIKDNLYDINKITETGVNVVNIQTIKNCFYRAFPELAESEDEKIRKELIEHVKDQQSSFISAPDCRDKYEEEENNKYNAWLAWLEKQGRHSDKIVERAKTEKQRVLITESDGEANIDWDTRSLQDVKLLLEYSLDYVNKLEKQGGKKPADKVEPAWSEEDAEILSMLIELVEHKEESMEVKVELITWLKSLKQKTNGIFKRYVGV